MNPEITSRQLEIIDAAGKILTVSGVSGLTIKNLAKEMQFSESAIYRHFTSKEQIIMAMLGHLSQTMDARLARAIRPDLSPEEKFQALFDSQLEFFDSNPHFVVAVFSDGLMEESKAINEAIYTIMQTKMKYLMPLMKEGVQKGFFTSAIPVEDLVHIVMGSFRLQMFKWRQANFSFDILLSGKKLMHSLLKVIRNTP
ncbi:MAG: TetR/AcrR family transcriptional regulator [Adhaeribacter sp.]